MDKYYIRNGSVYRGHKFEKAPLLVCDGKIHICEAEEAPEGCVVVDAQGLKVVPGFIDIHTHGAVGVDVNGASAADLKKIGAFFAENGTTSWLASVLTDTQEQTEWCIDQYKLLKQSEAGSVEAREQLEADRVDAQKPSEAGSADAWEQTEAGSVDVQEQSATRCAELLGLHLEGPFLAKEYKGAMPEYLLRKGDKELAEIYQKRAEGGIRYMTVSPEVEGVSELIPELKKLGIVTAIGHSGADYAQSCRAIEAGAECATHTFNAMRLLHQHEPAILGAALESDIYCEMICDGIHLHPGIVRLLLKVKGPGRLVAITDSIMAAGLPDGSYHLGVNEVVVKDGDAKLKSDGTRAGSTLTQIRALHNLLRFTGRPLEELLPMFTENPAKLIGVYDRKGSIEEGKDADLVLLDENGEIRDVFLRGRRRP